MNEFLTSHLTSAILRQQAVMEKYGSMNKVDEVLSILYNGDWHRLAEVAERTGTQESKVELISSFLSAYDFLKFDKRTKRIKLSHELHEFLEKITEIEQKEVARENSRPS
jgi:hypothetical protein